MQPGLSARVGWVWIKTNHGEFDILYSERLLNNTREAAAHILVKEDDTRQFLRLRYARYLQQRLSSSCIYEELYLLKDLVFSSDRELWKLMFFPVNQS